jgi:hypothetical protein
VRKLTLLRDHLLASVPALAERPEALLTYIEAGSIAYQRDEQGSAAAVYSHQYRCPVKLVVLDWSGDLDAIVLPLIAWLQHWQPDAAGPNVIGLAAEITAENKLDLELSVTLTERVAAGFDCDTRRVSAAHILPEHPVPGDCPAPLRELWLVNPDGSETAIYPGSPANG